MSSGVLLRTDIARRGRHVANVPGTEPPAEKQSSNPLNEQLDVVVGFNKVYDYRDRLKGTPL